MIPAHIAELLSGDKLNLLIIPILYETEAVKKRRQKSLPDFTASL
jgi:hypothetical protein